MRRRYIKLKDDLASMNGALDQGRADRLNSGQLRFCRSIALLVSGFVLGITAVLSQAPASVTLQGKVSDASGVAIANALVRLEHAGSSTAETKTAADGSFIFSGLSSGDYTLTAESNGRQSTATSVHADPSSTERVSIVIGSFAPTSAQATDMEFADSPNFTVAAVTDWTAAGGHGSDAVLRTSEALNRETANLKPGESRAAGPAKDGKQKADENNGDAHRQAGELDEKLGDPLAAVHEFERAVRADPSEQNYFAWGSELLLHRAVWQARDVFSAGVKAYPKSGRMLTALGAALFAGALYDEAAQRLCAASDLNPADPEPYTFMGKIEISAPNPLPCVEQKLARYAAQKPSDPLANYFYAMALWKQGGPSPDPATFARVQGLLQNAVKVDPQCSEAWLQLGVLEAARPDYAKAIEFYTKAIDANPEFSEAHYRLGIAYDRVGERNKAAEQLRLHEQLEKDQAATVEKQRRQVKQFLVVVDGKKSDSSPEPQR